MAGNHGDENEMWHGAAIMLAVVVASTQLPTTTPLVRREESAATLLEKPVSEETTRTPCLAGNDIRQSDLCAQWKAADSADRAAHWAKWEFWSGLLLGMATLLGVGVTVYQTQRTVRITQDTLHADRAWMTAPIPWGVFEGDVWSGDPTDKILPIIVQWTNTGRSPAVKTSAVVRHKFVDPGDPPPLFETSFDKEGMLIGPEGWFRPPTFTLDRVEMLQIFQKEKDLYVWSRCKYYDVFQPKLMRETTICFQIVLDMENIDFVKSRVTTSVNAVEGQHSYS